jgi:hypothetical protein
MEHFGRRKPLIIGGIWQSMWLFIFGAVGTACDTSNKAVGSAMIVAVSLFEWFLTHEWIDKAFAQACMFIFGYASTWAPGIWILTGESFPMRTRAKQAALATASNWMWK